MLFQSKVQIGPQIVEPDFLGLPLRAGGALIKEDHICLDAGLVEDSGGQSENGVEVAGLQQLLPDSLPGSALKEHIVRHHHRRLSGGFQKGVDVLEEVELLVGAGGPEILPVVDQVLFLLLPLLIGEGEGGFFAKGRIGEHIVEPLPRVGEQGVPESDGDLPVQVADVVEKEVHQTQFEGNRHDLPAPEGVPLQKLLGLPVQGIVLGVGQVALGRQQEAAAAAAGVGDGFPGLRSDALHHGPDQRPGREVLARAAFHVLGVLLQQALVDLALHVGGHGHPVFLVDHLDDAVEDGGVADLVDRPLKDLAQGAALLPQCLQDGFVLALQFRAFQGVHIRPAAAGGDAGLPLVGWFCVLVGHFQKNQVCKLLQVVAVGHAVVPQGTAHPPDFGDDG